MSFTVNNPPSPVFQAAWPQDLKPTTSSILANSVWNVVSVILFPIGIARLVYSGMQILGSALVHPASFGLLYESHHLDACRNRLKENGGEEVAIRTPDGKTLNCMLFRGTNPGHSGIVKAFGNGGYYETRGQNYLDFVRTHVGSEVDVLMVNYRGCAKSEGRTSPLGLALDTYSAAEYLTHCEGLHPNKILFHGHSLGGYAAPAGAALFQKQHPDTAVSVLCDRTMKSLSYAARHISGPFSAWLVSFLNWELNAQKAWASLKGQKIVVYSSNDAVSSFHHYVQMHIDAESGEGIHQIELEKLTPHEQPWESHNRHYTNDEGWEIGGRIRNALL